MLNKKDSGIKPLKHYNIADFNRGQSSKIIRKIEEEDSTAFVLKHGKPIAVIISNEKYERLLKKDIDINIY